MDLLLSLTPLALLVYDLLFILLVRIVHLVVDVSVACTWMTHKQKVKGGQWWRLLADPQGFIQRRGRPGISHPSESSPPEKNVFPPHKKSISSQSDSGHSPFCLPPLLSHNVHNVVLECYTIVLL